jgi:WD40 repeat protein
MVLGPLKEHVDGVTSVIFSPDSARIVFSSPDTTIWLWDARGGEVVIDPLEHTHSVSSVGLSPNGTGVVSGAWHNNLRVWMLEVKR